MFYRIHDNFCCVKFVKVNKTIINNCNINFELTTKLKVYSNT